HRLHEQLLVSPAATVGSHSLDWPPRVMAMSRQRTGPGGVAPTQLPPLGLLKLSVKSAASVVVPRPVKVMAEAAPELTTTPLFPAPSAKDLPSMKVAPSAVRITHPRPPAAATESLSSVAELVSTKSILVLRRTASVRAAWMPVRKDCAVARTLVLLR